MKLYKCYATNNECYKRNVKMNPKGIFVHSTGANNPYLKRYVQPDDGRLGVNSAGNHFNTYRPGGRQVCVHAFIGKLKDGTVATYQTLPWNMKGWHSGVGTKGSANNMGYIGFEICEDGLADKTYFNAVYKEAVELVAYLCKLYNLNPKDSNVVMCHSEGHKKGIASNHGDVMHWFPKFGKSMDTFRTDVYNEMHKSTTTTTNTTQNTNTTNNTTQTTTSTSSSNQTVLTPLSANTTETTKPTVETKKEDELDMTVKEFIDSLTNEQAYTIYRKAIKYTEKQPVSDWVESEGHFAKAKELGITDGSAPKSPITREQIFTVLGRAGMYDDK